MHAVSVTAAPGFEAGGHRVRHQAVGRARPRARRDRATARRCPRPACSPATSRAPRRCRSAARHLARRPRRRGGAQLRQRERGDGRAGPRATRGACASSPPRASGVATADVLVCSTGLIGIPMPMAARRGRHPEARAPGSRPTGRRHAPRPRRSSPPTPSRKEAVAAAELGDGRRHRRRAWPRARRCSRRRWRRCSRCVTTDAAVEPGRAARRARRTRCATRSTPDRRRAARARTTPCSCSRTARRARADRRRAGTRTTRSPRRSPRCATSSPQQMAARRRGRDEARAPSSCAAPRSDDDARRAARAVAAQPARAVLALRRATRTGAGCSRSSARAARCFDPERVDISYNGVTVCRDGIARAARRGRARRGDGRRARSRSSATCTPGTGEATVRFTDLTHAYIDENTGTS